MLEPTKTGPKSRRKKRLISGVFSVPDFLLARPQTDLDSPPERLLQAVWLHQRLRRDQLKTLDGQPVRVLHPGFHNLESGPDFRGAVVQVGQESPRSGDVKRSNILTDFLCHAQSGRCLARGACNMEFQTVPTNVAKT